MPVYDTAVELKIPKKPVRIYLAPQNKSVKFEYANGRLSFSIDKFECHQMVVIDM